MLAAFDSATGAVQAAIAAQLRLDGGLPFRVGLHLGDIVEKEDGSLYGDGVNVASRLQALAEPGGIVASHAIHSIVAARGVAVFDDAGEHALKNVAAPVRAWRVRHAATTLSSPGSLLFDRFEIRHRERRLLVEGELANVGDRTFEVLLALATQPGSLLTKQQLMDWVWPGAPVDENTVATQIRTLRKLLGGNVVETIPGHGYRLAAASDVAPEASSAAQVIAVRALREPVAATPSSSAPPVRTNLPEHLPALLGRADDLAALKVLLVDRPLMTLVGAGGIGKSSVARALLHAERDDRTRWKHGVCWVELATVTDPSALPGTLATALGIRIAASEPLAGLCTAVAPLTMLVALDNAEHLIEAVAQLAQVLIDAAPGVRLLVTSQAPLKLAHEQVVRLESLAVPGEALPAEQARAFGAVALFVERAKAADARFSLTNANAAAVIELCRSLDGLPLAIELAAARAPVLGVQRLATSMKDRLKLLTSSRNRGAPARQQTLRAALEWSHGLLDAQATKVFRRLSVFAGSASLALVQQVVVDRPDEGDLDEWTALDALAVLVERSLAAVLHADDAAEPRYRLLESPREYALERLKDAGEEAAIRLRHVRAMAGLFEAASREFYAGAVGYNAWMQAMALDADNAREAMAHAEAAGEEAALLQIGATLLQSMQTRPVVQLTEVADRCAAHARDGIAPEVLARACIEIAAVRSRTQPRDGLAAAQRAVDVVRSSAETAGDAWLLYRASCMLALTAYDASGDRALIERALAEARALEDGRWPPQRLLLAVDVELTLAAPGSVEQKRLLLQRLRLWLAAGGSGYITRTMIVESELAAGDAAAAVRTGEALLADLKGSRDEYWRASAQTSVTAAHLALDDLASARRGAEPGWRLALLFGLQCPWADYLALLAALEQRPRAAALIAGYSDAVYATRDRTRQFNEAGAFERACRLTLAALGDSEFARLRREGRQLRDDRIASIALATADVR